MWSLSCDDFDTLTRSRFRLAVSPRGLVTSTRVLTSIYFARMYSGLRRIYTIFNAGKSLNSHILKGSVSRWNSWQNFISLEAQRTQHSHTVRLRWLQGVEVTCNKSSSCLTLCVSLICLFTVRFTASLRHELRRELWQKYTRAHGKQVRLVRHFPVQEQSCVSWLGRRKTFWSAFKRVHCRYRLVL